MAVEDEMLDCTREATNRFDANPVAVILHVFDNKLFNFKSISCFF